MEPKGMMRVVACLSAALLVLLSLAGRTAAALWAALGLLALALSLHFLYRRLLASGRREGRAVPSHRAELDREVLIQWAGVVALALLASVLAASSSLTPLGGAGQLVEVLIGGATIAAVALFISMLVDWYLILPKMSGLAGPAPCESPGPTRWRNTTLLWYFHRGALTAIIYAVTVGGAAYLSDSISSPALKAAYLALGASIALFASYFYRELPRAVMFSLNAPVHVGDQLYLYVETGGVLDSEAKKVRRRGYVVDVSLQGVKCKVLRDGRYEGERFESKDDQTVSNSELHERRVPARYVEAQCGAGECCGVNWYCRHNPNAYR